MDQLLRCLWCRNSLWWLQDERAREGEGHRQPQELLADQGSCHSLEQSCMVVNGLVKLSFCCKLFGNLRSVTDLISFINASNNNDSRFCYLISFRLQCCPVIDMNRWTPRCSVLQLPPWKLVMDYCNCRGWHFDRRIRMRDRLLIDDIDFPVSRCTSPLSLSLPSSDFIGTGEGESHHNGKSKSPCTIITTGFN